jgi:DNA-binding protein H-NS
MPDFDIPEAIEQISDIDELLKVIATAESRLEEVRREFQKEVKREIRQRAAYAGLEVDIREMSATGKKAKSKKKYGPTKLSPKYRNPDNPEETWHGRGPWPDWFKELMDAGRQKKEFLIPT